MTHLSFINTGWYYQKVSLIISILLSFILPNKSFGQLTTSKDTVKPDFNFSSQNILLNKTYIASTGSISVNSSSVALNQGLNNFLAFSSIQMSGESTLSGETVRSILGFGLGVPNNAYGYSTTPFLPPGLVAPTSAVGATDGNFSVDLSGHANYVIPLSVSPGTGGMQPNLSIAYSSGAPNGLLGSGFGLSGLSAITRAGTNKLNSDSIRPVTYTAKDKFYLDGNLLVCVSGTYGANGAEYRTQSETFSKIISYGTAGSGPQYFKVWTKDGNIFEYANTADSRIEAQGKTDVQTWAVNKITDLQNNYMTFTYTENNTIGSFYISQIDYTGNTSASLSPYASVKFTYEDKPDAFTYYTAGCQTQINKRLQNIKMYYGTDVARAYYFTYQNSGAANISQLKTIQECGTDGTCFAPTTFSWENVNLTLSQPALAIQAYNASAGWNANDYTTPTQMADVNGDGKNDIVGFGTDGVYVSLSNGDGTFTPATLQLQAFSKAQGWGSTQRLLGDVNGDGFADIVGIGDVGFQVSLATGNGGFNSVTNYNGFSVSGTYASVPTFTLTAPSPFTVPPPPSYNWFNNEGKYDQFTDCDGQQITVKYYDYTTTYTEYLGTTLGYVYYPINYTKEIFSYDEKYNCGVIIKSNMDKRILNDDYSSNFPNKFTYDPQLATSAYYKNLPSTPPFFSGYTDAQAAQEASEYQAFADKLKGGYLYTFGSAPATGYQSAYTNYCNLVSWYQNKVNEYNTVVTNYKNAVNNYNETYNSFINYHKNINYYEKTLQDLNADGKMDVIWYSADGVKVSLATAGGFAPWVLTSDFQKTGINATLNWSGNNHPIMLGEVNGDGLPDLIGFHDQGVYVAKSKGDGTFYPSKLISSEFRSNAGWNSTGFPVTLADVNGDGLSDIVGYGNNGPWISLANGNGTYKQSTQPANLQNQFLAANGWHTPETPVKLSDINNDGMQDMIAFAADGVYTSLALGNGNFAITTSLTISYGINDGWNTTSTPIHLSDINGDGVDDFVAFGNTDTKSSITNTNKANIISIVDALSNTTSINYDYLTNSSLYTKTSGAVYPAIELQTATEVVSSYASSNGVGGQNTVNQKYQGLRSNFLTGAGGFSKITSTNQTSGIVQSTTYNNVDYHYNGMPLLSETKLTNGTTIAKTTYSLALNSYSTSIPSERWFAYQNNAQSQNYELNGTLIDDVSSTNIYDDFGNLINNTLTHKDGHQSIQSYTLTNNTSAGAWLIGLIDQQAVTQIAPGQSNVVKTVNYTHYPNSNLRKTSTSNSGTALQLLAEYTYDAFGNLTQTKVTGNNGWSGAESRITTATYDAKGRFAINSTNQMGHTASNQYNQLLGVKTSFTSNNGFIYNFEYDAFGRLTKETSPDGLITSHVLSFASGGSVPQYAKYYVSTKSSMEPESIEYYDALDRLIRTESSGFDGTKIFTDDVYDAKGYITQSSFPYYANQSPVYKTMLYDDLGRVYSTTTPQKGTSTINYNGLTVSATNELGQSNTQIKNNIGRLITTIDNQGNTVSYEYFADGNLKSVTDPDGVITNMQYDLNGNRTVLNDPDTKITQTFYNAFGELWKSIDNKGTVLTTYDKLGRELTVAEPENTYTYTYDAGNKAIGKLSSVSSNNGYSETYSYDNLGRQFKTQANMPNGGGVFAFTKTFDQYGRTATLTYPSGFAVQNEYNANNYLAKVKGLSNGITYYTANELNAFNQAKKFTLGNGLQTQRLYSSIGQLKNIITGSGGSASIQNLEYNYNELGNIISRKDFNRNVIEELSFDDLNRLQNSTIKNSAGSTLASLQMEYNINGNILYKSDVGCYTYSGANNAGPHAVTATPLGNYAYDTNGNMITSPSFTAAYTSFNLPGTITKATKTLNNFYNHIHTKYLEQELTNGVETQKTFYYGGIYEKEIAANGTVKQKHYILANGNTIAIYTQSTDAAYPSETVYVHKDHLGSTSDLTTAAGNIKESFSYDAWGKRRNPNTWLSTGTFNNLPFYDMGYTGHENIDDIGVIDMGGRIYEPTLARFLSADPFVQAPENLQSFNRYSYVLNDPLSNIDPSGFISIGSNYTPGNITWDFDQIGGVLIGVKGVEFPNNGGLQLTAYAWGGTNIEGQIPVNIGIPSMPNINGLVGSGLNVPINSPNPVITIPNNVVIPVKGDLLRPIDGQANTPVVNRKPDNRKPVNRKPITQQELNQMERNKKARDLMYESMGYVKPTVSCTLPNTSDVNEGSKGSEGTNAFKVGIEAEGGLGPIAKAKGTTGAEFASKDIIGTKSTHTINSGSVSFSAQLDWTAPNNVATSAIEFCHGPQNVQGIK